MNEILIIEQDIFFSNILSSLIQYLGFQSKRCVHPEYLPEYLRKKPYDVILINFHDENKEMIHILNKIHKFQTKIILLSHFYDKEIENEPFYPLIFAYLIKPKGLIYLKEVLNQAFNKEFYLPEKQNEKQTKKQIFFNNIDEKPYKKEIKKAVGI